MLIKIAKDGSLKMLRKDRFILMTCPFTDKPDYDRNCGDWCPLFNIEEVYEPGNMSCSDERLLYFELSLCHGKKYKVDKIDYD